jgi:serine/threonine protein kinase
MNGAQATLIDGRRLDFVPEVIGDGTMKEVYFTPDRKSVVCFYKDAAASSDPVRLQRLEWILGKYNPTVPRDQGGAAQNAVEASYYHRLYCWPTAMVSKPRFGFLAPAYPDNFFFHSGPDFLKGKEKNGMRFIGLKNRSLLEKFAPAELGSWINYFALCVQMARAVARLHVAGLAHSDLSPNNVLVDPAKGLSIMIDIDSLVVEDLFPLTWWGQRSISPRRCCLPSICPSKRHSASIPIRRLTNMRCPCSSISIFYADILWRAEGFHP